MEEPENRRPLKSRASGWAGRLASLLTKSGITPNAISVASVVFAVAAGACLLLTLRIDRPMDGIVRSMLFVAAALCIQLRLICNLMDGMVAVEGGKGGPCGEIFNDFPDRLADVAILACAGYVTECHWGVVLGWVAACGAVTTAYVRVLGTALTGTTDFRGVMAKPQRMAVMTVACVAQAFVEEPVVLWVALGLVVVGVVVTIAQRLWKISNHLKGLA